MDVGCSLVLATVVDATGLSAGGRVSCCRSSRAVGTSAGVDAILASNKSLLTSDRCR